MGAIWTSFDEQQGPKPQFWTPSTISEDLLFNVSLRAMSIYTGQPADIMNTYFSVIPLPEHNISILSTIFYEPREDKRGKFAINLVSLLIPIEFLSINGIDQRQLQAIFVEHLNMYKGSIIENKENLLYSIALEAENLLVQKLALIKEADKLKENLGKYLESYIFQSMNSDDRYFLSLRIDTFFDLLDKSFQAGNVKKIKSIFDQLIFLLEQGLDDELVNLLTQTIQNAILV